MEYIAGSQLTEKNYILCCECGTQIEPNPANMCVACLRSSVDITDGIPKQVPLYFCRNCERYLQPPATWCSAALESKELLAICLKRLKGLNKVRLVDAGFVWTEPHSKRVKVKLTVQKEVVNGAILQQVFIVEFVVHNQMCDECHRVEAKDYWRACVQIRQKSSHKKTLLYLEQLILKHKAHVNATGIKPVHGGLDFYYQQQHEAKKLAEFLQLVVPCRLSTAKELVSHDPRCNIYNYKHTFSVEIVPVSKDSVVCLSKKFAQQLGNLGQICIVLRVTQVIHLIDPVSCRTAEVSGTAFWRNPFTSLCDVKQLTEFVVMEIEITAEHNRCHYPGLGSESQKHVPAEVWVVRSRDLGTSNDLIHCRTHLGHLLNHGDTVLGFEVRYSNVNDTELDKIKPENRPDIVLVKKVFAESSRRAQRRRWRLQRLDDDLDRGSLDRDYNDFLEDLEEDPQYRREVNIYKDHRKLAVDADDDNDGNLPSVSLAEMLDDLHIDTDATGEAGAAMME